MELNVDEALRYLGIGGQAAESIRASVAAVADKLTAAIQPRYTYRMCSLQKTEAGFLLPEAELILPGADAAKMLEQCDQVEQELAHCLPNRYRTDRFSPGYGDLPLSLQPKICAALDTQRRLGLYVTESYLMNPSKSVTAIIGLSDWPQMARIRGCTYCSMRETCKLRVGGKHCGN